MGRLEQGAFLARLEKLYRETRNKGTLTVTYKRATAVDLRVSDAHVERKAPAHLPRSLDAAVAGRDGVCCLVRAVATGGEPEGPVSKSAAKKAKVKISCVVSGADQVAFHTKLAALSKAKMDGLKKRSRQTASKKAA
jgi:hypothetical protein